MVEQSDEVFEESARLLIGRQFLRRHVIGGYRIAHDRMRQWVYARNPEADRRALHVRVLRALEATGLTDDETVYASAHHAWHRRDLRARALNLMRRHAPKPGTARIWQGCATNAPSRLLDEAAEPAFAMTLHERLADLAFLSASYSRALTGYEQALRLGHGLGDEVRLRRRIGDTLSKTGRLAQARHPAPGHQACRAPRGQPRPGIAGAVPVRRPSVAAAVPAPTVIGPTTVEARPLAGEVGRAGTSLGLLNLFVCDAKARGFLYRGMNLAARCRDDALLCETPIHRIWTCLTQTDFKGAHANLRDARGPPPEPGRAISLRCAVLPR